MNRETVGLTIMDAQPFHNGHCELINEMLNTCSVGIILLSTLKERTNEHPLSYEERKLMIKNCYPNEIDNILFVSKYDERKLENSDQWFNRIWGQCVAMYSVCPTHYFSGRDGELEKNISKRMQLVTLHNNSSKSKSIRNSASKGDYQKMYLNMHPVNALIFQTISEDIIRA